MCSYIYSREPNETKVAQACVEDDACVQRESGACTKNDNVCVCAKNDKYIRKKMCFLSLLLKLSSFT